MREALFLIELAGRSLLDRRLTTLLTIGSIAASVALMLGTESLRTGVRTSFSNTLSQTDLIVGARGGRLQLLLYTVFGYGAPRLGISPETHAHWDEHPAVAWTVPYALGDSYRGFRVIGTSTEFYEHYRYRGGRRVELAAGRPASAADEVVLGAEVARRLGHAEGDRIVVAHGLDDAGFLAHDDRPFTVVGILARTATPVDRALYVTLPGIAAMHDEPDAAEVRLSSFLLGARERADVLRLRGEIHAYQPEPLTAVIPAVALGELWRGLGSAESALRLITAAVVAVGLLGLVVALYGSLDARRHEIAVLRAVGASPGRVLALLLAESGLIAGAGAVLGIACVYPLVALTRPAIEERFGLVLPLAPPSGLQLALLAAVVTTGLAVGLIPAWRAYATALHDGLTPRP